MIVKNIGENFSQEDLEGETSRSNNGAIITIYKGDEPVKQPEPIILPPNWLTLEQSLRYSALFGKAFVDATDKGLNLFMITLLNGKRGEASEAALSFAFANLGVTWTTLEKAQINAMLTANNFTVQIV